MEYRELGNTGLNVSAFCLGTMTFGVQTSAKAAHLQLDRALDAGVNLVDTAEMYPSPSRAQTYGLAEKILGDWLKRNGKRNSVFVATKAAGPGAFVPWIRGGDSVHDENNLNRAVDASLTRLRTDYIDLFQLHWPDRAANFFGQLGFKPAKTENNFNIEGTLHALSKLVRKGKIRHIGVSNETPWGVMKYLHLATDRDLPRIAAIQNPYNLLNRSFEVGLAEIACREKCRLLAYSPLGFGTLTGKYLQGRASANARLNLSSKYGRYSNVSGLKAAERYMRLAGKYDINPTHMALAFAASKPFVTSVIIGATSKTQLDHNLRACDIELSRELTRAIDAVHEEISNPCP